MTGATNDDRHHITKLVSNAKVAMLTTTAAKGKQVSRPMGLQEAESDGDLWFFADDDSAKVSQIRVHGDTAECCWEGPSSTVGFARGLVRAAVPKEPDLDPSTNNTVQL